MPCIIFFICLVESVEAYAELNVSFKIKVKWEKHKCMLNEHNCDTSSILVVADTIVLKLQHYFIVVFIILVSVSHSYWRVKTNIL